MLVIQEISNCIRRMNEKQSFDELSTITANRRLVEQLYVHGKITREGRSYALDFLNPHHLWGLWLSRIMLTLGTLLVLSGIIYFFAFNWAALTPTVKFTAIQSSIVLAVIGSCVFSLKTMYGQTLLLAASILVGVFMAVFGQIYQTGADAYQLFMMWSLFTLGWTIISKFALQWVFWLVITNTCLVLWWQQAALPTQKMAFMIFAYMAIFNGMALALCEHFAGSPKYTWLMIRWTRLLLIITTLVVMLIPLIALIVKPFTATMSILLSSFVGIVGHSVLFYFYRYKQQNTQALAAIILSFCIIAVTIGFRILLEGNFNPAIPFMMGLVTLSVFSIGIIYLRKTANIIGRSTYE